MWVSPYGNEWNEGHMLLLGNKNTGVHLGWKRGQYGKQKFRNFIFVLKLSRNSDFLNFGFEWLIGETENNIS